MDRHFIPSVRQRANVRCRRADAARANTPESSVLKALLEKCSLDEAATQQPRNNLSAGMVPFCELVNGSFEVAHIEFAKQSGTSKGLRAEIENKVHQSVEFFLL